MRSQLLVLVLLGGFGGCGYPSPVLLTLGSQSDCPTVAVKCPDVVDNNVLTFKVKLSGGKVTHQSLTYKWTVHGGEIKDGQGTDSVTIINFDLRKRTLTVVVDVGGLPAGCAGNASCSISV